MTERQETQERTAGGPLGKLAGEAKEAVGAALGKEELAKEGRLQQVQAEQEAAAARRVAKAEEVEREAELVGERAETEAERRELEADLGKEAAEEAIDRGAERAQREAEQRTREEVASAEAERRAEEAAAQRKRQAGAIQGSHHEGEAARLKQQAQRAEAVADAVDPEEDR